jgi:succinate dehydrogenase / fumarate reductase cytochrome b subunit
VTATHPAPPPISPDITVKPVNKRARPAPFPINIYQTAVGKKWVMALTGIAMMGFVFAHMIGNVKMYLGPEEFNAYAAGLRTMLYPILPDNVFLWIMRSGLIVAFLLHLHAAYTLTVMNQRARSKYQSKRDYIAANYASRTMRYSGIILLAFIGFHLGQLTFGKVAEPGYNAEDVYNNVVIAFDQTWVSIVYIVSMLALALHLFHGAWSLFQSLGVNNPRYNGARKWFAAGFAIIVAGINITFPIAVMAGVVGP